MKQTAKLLYLKDIFEKLCDDNHPLSIAVIQEELNKRRIQADSRSIREGIEDLQDYGMNIRHDEHSKYYYFEREQFELPEIKLLIDCVQDSRAITKERAESLIEKLEGLCSKYEAESLHQTVQINGSLKSANHSIYYYPTMLQEAITAGWQVSFKYFDYDVEKKRVYQNDGKATAYNPYGLFYRNGRYYLLVCPAQAVYDSVYGFSSYPLDFFDLDRMADLKVLQNIPRMHHKGARTLIDKYRKRCNFDGFDSYTSEFTLKFENRFMNEVLEKFGMDVPVERIDDTHFKIHVFLTPTSDFFDWIFRMGLGGEIVSPQWAIDSMSKSLFDMKKNWVTRQASAARRRKKEEEETIEKADFLSLDDE